MITELFGKDIIYEPLSEVKKKIRMLPPAQRERNSYLLHDWAACTGHALTNRDYEDVEGLETN